MVTTTQAIPILFLGSFLEYSATVLAALHRSPTLKVVGVITTPAMPAGRKQIAKKTEVQELAEKLGIPVATPHQLNSETLAQTTQELGLQTPPPIMITAGYGKLLPAEWLAYPTLSALNLHFSLLPAYRGANPAEWALLRNETETGVTVITMSAQFDTGAIVAKASLAISPADTRQTLYQRLYTLGGELLPTVISYFVARKITPQPQPTNSPTPYAKRFNRDDGFVAWEGITAAMAGQPVKSTWLAPLLATALGVTTTQPGQASDLARAARALEAFPGLWTVLPTAKGPTRMKLLQLEVKSNSNKNNCLELVRVQIAGQQPAAWNQVKTILK